MWETGFTVEGIDVLNGDVSLWAYYTCFLNRTVKLAVSAPPESNFESNS